MYNMVIPLSITDIYVITMVRVMGKEFDGARDYFYSDWRLQIDA